jgi:hypothetical protein
MMPLATLFDAPDAELVSIGTLHVPTGRIAACDPFACASTAAFARTVPKGDHAVKLHRVVVGDAGIRTASARLIFRPDQAVVTVVEAELEGGGVAPYFVDAGLGAFVDDAARVAFADILDAFYRINPNGNYYTDVLAAEFKQHAASPSDPDDIGDWTMHRIGDASLNIAMFSSGMGDGAYTSYWGLNGDGDVVALLTEFVVR